MQAPRSGIRARTLGCWEGRHKYPKEGGLITTKRRGRRIASVPFSVTTAGTLTTLRYDGVPRAVDGTQLTPPRALRGGLRDPGPVTPRAAKKGGEGGVPFHKKNVANQVAPCIVIGARTQGWI